METFDALAARMPEPKTVTVPADFDPPPPLSLSAFCYPSPPDNCLVPSDGAPIPTCWTRSPISPCIPNDSIHATPLCLFFQVLDGVDHFAIYPHVASALERW